MNGSDGIALNRSGILNVRAPYGYGYFKMMKYKTRQDGRDTLWPAMLRRHPCTNHAIPILIR